MNRIVLGLGAATTLAMSFVASAAHAQDHVAATPPSVAPVVTVPSDSPPRVVVPPLRPIAPTFTETPAQSDTLVVDKTRPNLAMITSGLLMFGSSYAASTIVAAASEHPGDSHLAVPLVGPWLDLANRGACGIATASCGDAETANRALLVADGIFQGIGALGVIGGFLFPERVRKTEAKTAVAKKTTPKKVSLHFSPTFGDVNGLQATGKF